MTVVSTINRENLVAQAGDNSYDFTFKYFESTDIQLYIDTVLQTTGYSITSHANGPAFGGTVSLVTPMVGGEKVVIKRKLPNTQDTDYEENDDFPSQVAEDDYDRAAMRDQDQQEILDRCWKVGPSSTITDTVITDPDATSVGKGLIIAEGDTAGTYKVVYSNENISDILQEVEADANRAEAAANTADQDADRAEVAVGNLFQRANPPFTIVNGQTDYTLTYPVDPILRNAAVFISGVFQENIATNYIFPDENTIRFVGALAVGASAQVLTSLSASNPDLTQAVIDTIDFQDENLLKANSPKLLKTVFGDEAQEHVGTDLSGLTITHNHIEWTLTGNSQFSDVTLPYDGTYVFHIYPAGSTLVLATSYKTDGNLAVPGSAAGEIRIVVEQYNSRKSIISLQNMGA
jgi:hypothetical protein